MAEIEVRHGCLMIHGADAFLVLKDIRDGKIKVEIPSGGTNGARNQGTKKRKAVRVVEPVTRRPYQPPKAEGPKTEKGRPGWFDELERMANIKEETRGQRITRGKV